MRTDVKRNGYVVNMLKNEVTIRMNSKNKWIRYARYGEEHRLDGPSYLTKHRYITWEQYGKPHRVDGPAIISQTGGYSSWIRGKLLTC